MFWKPVAFGALDRWDSKSTTCPALPCPALPCPALSLVLNYSVSSAQQYRSTDNDTFAMPTDMSGLLPSAVLAQSIGASFFPPSSYIRQTFVSFGEKKDEVYNFPYVTWSFVVGLGSVRLMSSPHPSDCPCLLYRYHCPTPLRL